MIYFPVFSDISSLLCCCFFTPRIPFPLGFRTFFYDIGHLHDNKTVDYIAQGISYGIKGKLLLNVPAY